MINQYQLYQDQNINHFNTFQILGHSIFKINQIHIKQQTISFQLVPNSNISRFIQHTPDTRFFQKIPTSLIAKPIKPFQILPGLYRKFQVHAENSSLIQSSKFIYQNQYSKLITQSIPSSYKKFHRYQI